VLVNSVIAVRCHSLLSLSARLLIEDADALLLFGACQFLSLVHSYREMFLIVIFDTTAD
jgi:hypothetical protein